MSVILYKGDCLDILKTMPNDSVDSIVTDPPYGLSFMSKKWDYDVPSVAIWEETLRVLKPGGHLLSFSGTRTYHRMVVAIEDAGFEIRDQIGWLYGSGFPKSLDISKAIDKAAGVQRTEFIGPKPDHEDFITRTDAHSAGGRSDGWDRPWREDPEAVLRSHMQSKPVTNEAAKWQGWGTALKPAWEPIVMARKPLLIGTIAENVLAYGTGAINIDECRVETVENLNGGAYSSNGSRSALSGDSRIGAAQGMFQPGKTAEEEYVQPIGRWPANVIHDGSDEVMEAFAAFGESTSGAMKRVVGAYGDSGTAARFFYAAKASKAERNGSKHPTIKPVSLMRYLCRLVTPKGGTVLDPFAGSGTTGQAACEEGFDAILIEREAEYCEDIRSRLALWLKE